MGWNFKRGEMRKEVCMTWVCQGGPGRTGVHAGWVVQGEFGKGSFTKVWEGRRESTRRRGTVPQQVPVRGPLLLPGRRDRGREWDGSPSMSSALGSSGEVGSQPVLTIQGSRGNAQPHCVPPSHLLPGLPFGPAHRNPNANGPPRGGPCLPASWG